MNLKAVLTYKNDAALLLMRAMLGLVFVFHGAQKLFGWFGGPGLSGTSEFMASLNLPLPMASAVMAGGTEFVGGLLLWLGLGVPLVALPMIFTMIVAIVTVHPDTFSIQAQGMEYALTLAVMLAALALMGGGRWSLDGCLFKGRKQTQRQG